MMKNVSREEASPEQLPVSITQFIEKMKSRFGKSEDIIYREMTLAGIPTVMVYVEGLGDPRLLIEAIHADLPLFIEFPNQSPEVRMKMLKELTITMGKVGEASLFKRLKGNCCPGIRSSSWMEHQPHCTLVLKH